MPLVHWFLTTHSERGTPRSTAQWFAGFNYGEVDDASQLTTAQHIIQVNLDDASHAGADFGFSFNVVTNTDDAAYLGATTRSSQGSLRQFLDNANAIVGGNSMRFVPADATEISAGNYTFHRGAPNAGSGGSQFWQIDLTTALPTIDDPFTVIDGSAFNGLDGITQIQTNTSNLGTVGNVGLGADGVANTGDEAALAGLGGPELSIADDGGVGVGLHVLSSDAQISDLAIHGFGTAGGNTTANIVVGSATGSGFDRVTISNNVIGTAADGFAAPTVTNNASNILVYRADEGVITGNLIGFAGESGILIQGGAGDGADNWSISNNEIRGNGITDDTRDGIQIIVSSGTTIRSNLIVDNHGMGIDTFGTSGGLTIDQNTIQGNGIDGTQTAGIRMFGQNSTVTSNVIRDNSGAGVIVLGASDPFGAVVTGNACQWESYLAKQLLRQRWKRH